MVAYTITISNNFLIFGGSPASRWGEVIWGSFKWGDGSTAMIWKLGKLIGNDLSTDSLVKKVLGRTIYNNLEVSSENGNIEQIDREGWNYVFPKPTINAQVSTFTVWTNI